MRETTGSAGNPEHPGDPARLNAVTYQNWHCYFIGNKDHFSDIAWTGKAELTRQETQLIATALQQFQKGENSEGKHLIRFARRNGDPAYLDAITGLIREEQKHALVLWKFMSENNIRRIRGHWVDGVFRRLRQFGGLENSIRVLITAEIIAAVFYRGFRDATHSPTLRAICEQILRDEEMHINFQSFTLRNFYVKKGHIGKLFTRGVHRVLMIGTTVVVWLMHSRLLKTGGFTYRKFDRAVFREYARATGMIRGVGPIDMRMRIAG